jgi:AraC family transcriptional regulator
VFEWHKTIQVMVDIIEKQLYYNFDEEITLTSLAKKLGYSKFHITKRFKSLTGMTFRDYLRLRRLAFSVIELRDTNNRIIDVAVKYGFCSQEAYTRAFKNSYGITPNEYRNKKMPLNLKSKHNTFDPYYLGIGESSMNKSELQEVTIGVLTLPAHKFLHIRNINADNYFGFWALQEKIPGQGCNTICGLLDSISGKMDSVTGKIGEFDGQIGGNFFDEAGKKGYVYGIRLPADYSCELPKQMLCIDVPQKEYMVFAHPPFDYEKIGGSVNQAVGNAVDQYDFAAAGYEHDKTAIIYHVHSPEHIGCRTYVPIVRKEL